MMLSLDTAYRSFGGEVEASSTPTICRLPDSRRHQLWAIAPAVHESVCGTFRTSRHVRSSVAIGGKADVARTPRFGGEGPLADIETITGNPRGCFAWAVPLFGSVLTQPFWYPVMYWRCCRF